MKKKKKIILLITLLFAFIIPGVFSQAKEKTISEMEFREVTQMLNETDRDIDYYQKNYEKIKDLTADEFINKYGTAYWGQSQVIGGTHFTLLQKYSSIIAVALIIVCGFPIAIYLFATFKPKKEKSK